MIMIKIPAISLIVFLLTINSAFADSMQAFDQRFKESYHFSEMNALEKDLVSLDEKQFRSRGLDWRLARVYHALGERAPEGKQADYYQRCIERAERSVEFLPEQPQGYFFRGLCNGEIGRLQGILQSLMLIEPLKEDLKKAKKLDPAMEEGAPCRALGKLYLELPLWLGGDGDLAINYLKEALQLGPKHPDNYLFLAEAYMELGQADLGRDTLLKLIENIKTWPDSPKYQKARKDAIKQLKSVPPPEDNT